MVEFNREHKRIEKSLIMHFCVAEKHPKKWDMTTVENISAGGVRFTAPSDLKLFDKIIELQIKIPELAPHLLELEAIVLSAKPRANIQYSDIRAKFINVSDINKKHLSIVEKIIYLQEVKEAKKDIWKEK